LSKLLFNAKLQKGTQIPALNVEENIPPDPKAKWDIHI